MATPPTIADIDPAEVDGDVMRLLAPMGRAMRATEKCLRKGLTLADNVTAYIRQVDFLVPDDWVPVTLANGFTQHPATQFGTPAVRKTEDGEVETRGLLERGAGAPAAGTVIFVPPAGYVPPSNGDRRYIVDGGVGTPANLEIKFNTGFVYNGGPVTLLHIGALRWVAADRKPPAWSEPLLLDIEVPWRPAYVRVLDMRYSGEKLRRISGAGPVIWQEVRQTAAGVRQISIERILGLVPTQRYTMTLGVFPE